MSAVRIIRFGDRPPAPDIARPDKVIAGDPVTTTHNYFTDSSGAFFSGIWESTPGKWSCDYSESEFVYLISGRARLTDADFSRKRRERSRDLTRVPDARFGPDHERLSRLKLLDPVDVADAKLRSLDVADDGNVPAQLRGNIANGRHGSRVVLVLPM